MEFPAPLIRATLVRRYKRFLADVVLADGAAATAHCANPGAMLGLAQPGATIWLSPSPNPKAKLAWRWELEEVGSSLVGINTSHPNQLVAEAIRVGHIATLSGYDAVQREVRYGDNSRVDLLLSTGEQRCFVEVKNVHWQRGTVAAFPDSVTARGARHMAALAAEVQAGHRAVLVYCVQRSDCTAVSVAADKDPVYAAALHKARAAGVECLAYGCTMTPQGITLSHALPLELTDNPAISAR